MAKRLVLAILFSMAMVGTAPAQTLDLAFNDSSAEVALALPLRSDDYGSSQMRLRGLYNDEEETALGSLGVAFLGEPGTVDGLTLGIGARLNGGETDRDQEFITLAVGAKAAYAPGFFGPFSINAELFYAPSVFSILDAERMLESRLRAAYAITPKVKVHLGYQALRADFEDHGYWTIDEGLRIGFEARF